MAQKKLQQLQREFYYRQLGGSFPLVPLNQLARNYYLSFLGTNVPNNQVPLEQLESMWLKQYILSKGATPSLETGGHPVGQKFDLWRQALVASGYAGQIPHRLTDVQVAFYLNN